VCAHARGAVRHAAVGTLLGSVRTELFQYSRSTGDDATNSVGVAALRSPPPGLRTAADVERHWHAFVAGSEPFDATFSAHIAAECAAARARVEAACAHGPWRAETRKHVMIRN
jgi:hypothetical protein